MACDLDLAGSNIGLRESSVQVAVHDDGAPAVRLVLAVFKLKVEGTHAAPDYAAHFWMRSPCLALNPRCFLDSWPRLIGNDFMYERC